MGAIIWQKCLDCLEDELPSNQVNTWIRPLQVEEGERELRLFAPNKYILTHVAKEFLGRIKEVVNELGVSSVTLEIGSIASRSHAMLDQPNRTMHSSTFRANVELNRDFTFDTFVAGQSNELARAAALQVSENVGKSYNPLLLYGAVGLGKTHVMQAVGNAILEHSPHSKVDYMYSKGFMEDMVRAIEQGNMSAFNQYYRSVDVLLVDDIQFLAKGVKSQEEFFHVFNSLMEDGRQIVLTCDRYPKEVEGLEERLKSRFMWGMTAPIEPPELETRVAILIRKAELVEIDLPQEVAFFIAERLRSHVRELEGALKRVIANATFTGREITIELVRESLKDLLAIQDRQVGIDNIQKTVAQYFKIRLADLNSKRRTRTITRPRHLAMALAKELTNHSLPEIGDSFGGRDHTTVLHACKRIKELRDTNGEIREDYQHLLRILTT
ncbi:MAG: chromosomal replication initiator protein DnaA [Pseudomonadales bacterium]|nr:chromosomal replication initiator protein DnaA [Pseudomonadales bacterium]MDP7360911.1 chromosomal replication initiator protein DnaA [Pseudomonadales bacterium]HJN52080.1 chromosomal replication initiator protein DnaA [Pseudomonadales bacterium]